MRALVQQDKKDFGPVVAQMNQRVIERPHLRIRQPHLSRARSVDRMRNPGQRLGYRRGIFFLRQHQGNESVKLAVANNMQWRRRHVVALLVAGGDETCFRIHAYEGLP